MPTLFTKTLVLAGVLFVVFPEHSLRAFAQAERGQDAAAIVEGVVKDAQGQPVGAATVSLERTDRDSSFRATTDSQGHFSFQVVPAGSYSLRVNLSGYAECTRGPFVLHDHETKSAALMLTKDPSDTLAFSDEPAFTVAGVTDTTALGGHGSGPVMRNSLELSKETASLGSPGGSDGIAQEAEIRAALVREDNADLHAQLAEIEEANGHPVEAEREYERAATMQPTEPHLFSWGAELLLHHAPEPAIEVFSKGHRLYPQSSRMMLGLGAARYAQRSEEQAVQIFLEACDLNPADPTPYLFLGKLQVTERVVPPGWVERMKRFTELHPENAMAHYLYAVALMKQDGQQNDLDAPERELDTALKLDARLGPAYLQFGILRLEREDFSSAIVALQKAVALLPTSEEAHFRLAQAYRRTGDAQKAKAEIAQFKELSAQKDAEAERERHEIPQFVYTLRGQAPPAQQFIPPPK